MNGLMQMALWLAGVVVILGGIVFAWSMASSPLSVFNTLVPKDSGVIVERSLAYGSHDRQRLDIYRPSGAEGAPVLFFSYGGAWDSGEKGDYDFVGRAFAAQGYVTVIADYRLVPEVVYPDFVNDNALALAFVRAVAADYGGDPGRIVLMGHSAGAYNVAMLALDPGFAHLAPAIVGVIGLSGPYDFYPFDVAASRNAFGHFDRPEETQPINHVTRGAPAMLLVHGDNDPTVRLRNSTALMERLEAQAPGRSRLVIFAGANHADTLVSLAMPLRWRYPVFATALDFIETVTADFIAPSEIVTDARDLR